MNAFIIEDDALWRTKIAMIAAEIGIAILGKADNLIKSRKFLSDYTPDLIIADVILGDETAFELFTDGRFIDIPVLFLTQSNDPENYNKAKHLKYSHFLMKPFHALTLKAAIDILMKSYTREPAEQLKTIAVHDKYKEKIKVPLREIMYIQQQRNDCFVKTAHQQFKLKISLSNIAKELDNNFLQVNRACIINKYFITQLTDDKNFFRLGKEQIVIGKTFRDSVIEYLSAQEKL